MEKRTGRLTGGAFPEALLFVVLARVNGDQFGVHARAASSPLAPKVS